MKRLPVTLTLILVAWGCHVVPPREEAPVVIGLTGRAFYEPERTEKVQAQVDSNREVARKNWQANPSEDNYVWYGRRLGYLSRFRQAIDVFTEGIEKYPQSAKLYRHRGHRYISLRRLLFCQDGVILSCKADMANGQEARMFADFGSVLSVKMPPIIANG